MGPHRPLIAAIGLGLLLLGACDSGTTPPREDGPKPPGLTEGQATGAVPVAAPGVALVAQPALHDFGRVFDSAKVTTAFEVRNTGRKPVTIQGLTSSCACTLTGKAVKFPVTLAPGTSLTLPVTVDTAGYSGKREEWIRLTSDQDKGQPYTWLRMKLDITEEVALSDAYLFLGVIDRGKAVKGEVRVTGYGAGFRVTDVTSSVPYVTVRIAEQTEGTVDKPGLARIAIELTGAAPLGRVEEAVQVRTTSKRHPKREVRVMAVIQGELVVTPARLAFYNLKPGIRRSGTITLTSKMLDIEIVSVDVSIPYLRYKLMPAQGRERRIEVTVGEPPSGTAGEIRGTVKIRTNSKEQPTVNVPLVLYFVEAGD